MSLTARADGSIGLALIGGLVMCLGGFLSLVIFMDYMDTGEMSVAFTGTPCVVLGVISLAVIAAYNVPITRALISSAAAPGRRAAYFHMLFPVLLVSFMVATPRASFAPSITFAFPLLLVGAFVYPYTALQMKKWVRSVEMENLVVLKCFKCSYTFEMHKEEKWVRCPHCGQINMNPGRSDEGTVNP